MLLIDGIWGLRDDELLRPNVGPAPEPEENLSARGEVAIKPVPDVRRDMAGLGGAGRVLLRDEAESTEAAEEAENVDMVESRLGFFLDAENWKDGLDGVGGFDGVLEEVGFGLKIDEGGVDAAAAAKAKFNDLPWSSVGRSFGNSITGASRLLGRWRLSGVGVVGEIMVAGVVGIEVSRLELAVLDSTFEFFLSRRLSSTLANSVGAMVGGGRKLEDGEGKPGTAGELLPIETVSDWLDSIRMW